MSDWQQVSKEIVRLAEFFKPFADLGKVPEAVQAAEVEINRLRNVAKIRYAEINDLDKTVAEKKKELAQIDELYEKIGADKMNVLNRALAEKENEADRKLKGIQLAIGRANKSLADKEAELDLKTQEYKTKMAQMAAEMAAKEEEMQALSVALAKLLKK